MRYNELIILGLEWKMSQIFELTSHFIADKMIFDGLVFQMKENETNFENKMSSVQLI